MRFHIFLLVLVMFPLIAFAQVHLDVSGAAKIGEMQKANSADSVVVRLVDGTLAVRDVSTLSEFQVLSVSNDTVFLSNGGFVKIPGGTQTISREGLTVTLSDGGGNYTDSVNVYTAGSGINISDNVISTTASSSSPWFIGKDTLDGIVYFLYADSAGIEHGLIVAKTENPFLLWQNTATLVGANRSWDGVYDMAQMTDSPAKTYVEGLGSEWYLPSVDELSLLWHSRFRVNKALFDGSLTLLSLSERYWSSTEFDVSGAVHFSFIFGDTDVSAKTAFRQVRAIRSF